MPAAPFWLGLEKRNSWKLYATLSDNEPRFLIIYDIWWKYICVISSFISVNDAAAAPETAHSYLQFVPVQCQVERNQEKNLATSMRRSEFYRGREYKD